MCGNNDIIIYVNRPLVSFKYFGALIPFSACAVSNIYQVIYDITYIHLFVVRLWTLMS